MFNNAELGRPGRADKGAGPARTGCALRLVRTKIDGDLGCWEGFVSHGTLDLARLSVAGDFSLLTTGLKGGPTAADFTNGRFTTLAIRGEPPKGFLDFTKAKADYFNDGPAHRRSGNIILDEFEYCAIQMAGVRIDQRDRWLQRAMDASKRKSGSHHKGYQPQPYDQLAGAYRRAGNDHAARRIQLAKYRQRNRATSWHRWYSRLWNVLQDGVIGYGYAPLRALTWLLVIFVLGVLLFRYGAKPYAIANVHHHSFTLNDSMGYTLDLLLPTSSLQERQVWQSANGLGELAASSLVVFGWLLTATVFAAAGRVLQRS